MIRPPTVSCYSASTATYYNITPSVLKELFYENIPPRVPPPAHIRNVASTFAPFACNEW